MHCVVQIHGSLLTIGIDRFGAMFMDYLAICVTYKRYLSCVYEAYPMYYCSYVNMGEATEYCINRATINMDHHFNISFTAICLYMSVILKFLRTRTQTCTHARTHARTHAHTHTHRKENTVITSYNDFRAIRIIHDFMSMFLDDRYVHAKKIFFYDCLPNMC